MELPTICFVFPHIFIGIFIIIHILIFLLILKFIKNVEKLLFLWGMINWTIAIGLVFGSILHFLGFDSDNLKLLWAFLVAIISPITEDFGRFIVFSFIYKSKNHNFNNSLIFWAGHGGWESIVLISIKQLSFSITFFCNKKRKG